MDPVTIGLGLVVLALVAGAWWLLRKSRRISGDHVFLASRLSRGNRLFPTQVKITPTSVVHLTPQWFGQLEQSINIAHVASVKVDTDLLFAHICIETTGGHNAIHCRGHRKRDAMEMKGLIERFQTEYYKAGSNN
ncbi:MAG: hypothetical protein JJE40_13360 [Vicinamibacteria bacterium]|nr:hypothetical protein [Vicinamibacteria bacterium]